MNKLVGKINSNNIKGEIQGIINVMPTDEFIEKNYVETFNGDLFKNITNGAEWDTSNKKLVYNSEGEFSFNTISSNQINLSNVPQCFKFINDGYKILLCEGTANITVISLSVPYDTSTIINTEQHTYPLPPLTSIPQSIFCSLDGMIIYMFSAERLMRYDLSSSFDFSSGTLTGFIDLENWHFIDISIDGTKIYIHHPDFRTVVGFSVDVAWDFLNLDMTNPTFSPYYIPFDSFSFNNSGTQIVLIDWQNEGHVYLYYLANAWDLSSIYDMQIIGEKYAIPYRHTMPISFDDGIFAIAGSDMLNKYKYGIINYCISNDICKNTTGTDNEYKHVTLYANGTNLEDITFYIGENNNSTITYTELPTTGNTTTRKSQRVALNNTNKYGLNWKALGAKGSEIKKLQITYEKE